jgi:methylthioribose-1-phosphate isomerase
MCAYCDRVTRTIDWVDGAVALIDQTRLPDDLVVVRVDHVPTLVDCIQRLAVRGAPAIGVAGAFGVVLALSEPDFDAAVHALRNARPTAVNLARMVDRVAARAGDGFEAALGEALAIRDEEIAASRLMGERGAGLVDELLGNGRVRAMTICNTGGLATVERGTALAVIQTLHEAGRLEEALVLETRPLLQGARLTAWELQRFGAPYRLVVDAAASSLLARGAADVVVTGADRVAANGDTANKIGTYSLAVVASHHGIPFYVVAPTSTIDLQTPTGAEIPIEERPGSELTARFAAHNPAFDVTPADLITAIVTEHGVREPVAL